MNKIATTAEAEKERAELRSAGQPAAPTWSEERAAAHPVNRHGWLSRLRSYFILSPLIWAYTLILGTLSLICSLFDREGRMQHNLARFWSWLIMKTILSPVKVTGMDNVTGENIKKDKIDISKPRVYAVTHASALDIPILYVYLPFQFRIIFKSELLAYPFIGWHLKRSGQVCINQQNPALSIGAIKSALRSLRSGMPLVIFPEGGRTRDGKIQPFLPGAFFLAIKAQADIVPIALVDTFDLLPMNTYHIKCQPLEMRVGEPISTAGLTVRDTDEVSARVKSAIEALHSAPRTTLGITKTLANCARRDPSTPLRAGSRGRLSRRNLPAGQVRAPTPLRANDKLTRFSRILGLSMSDSIHLKLPDGSITEVPKGTTALDVAKSISPRLADAALAAKARPIAPSQESPNGDLIDLTRPLDQDTDLRIITERDPEALEVYRHSSAHLLAAAVLELFPETKLGHGPATENGFFYDFYRPTAFTPEDLEKIEKKMQELVQQNLPYAREFLPRKEGLEKFKGEGDFMKCHFIEQFTKPDEKISIYKTGKFLDFCRGPHLPSTGKIKAFKLLSIAGAYWLGDEKNPQLQRIYGTSFFSKKDLDAYLNGIEEAKKRDHRVLGKQLDLFSIQELAGPGLIFWHPKGGIIRKEMEDWMREEYLRRGYSLVCTPHVARRQLFFTSGHEGYYSQNFFDVMELDDAEYRLKPMNCPGHILIYKDSLKSYRDLPVRLGELGTVYRYERSGVMHGLLRVRGFTQDDAHIFCTPDQIEAEIVGCLEFALEVLKDFGFDKFETELSTWDPKDKKSFLGSEEQWNLANHTLESALKKLNIKYKTMPGEAAFYGPKIDVKLVDAIGRLWQLSTVQFDFNLPQRFQLEYVAEDGSRKQPLMVHRALYGSVERFFGVLIEHYAGAFPVWLSPVQVAMIPIAERHVEYAAKVASQLRAAGVRVEVDSRNEKMNAKIREQAMQKVPFLLVVGDKESEANKVNVRTRGKEKTEDMATGEFVEKIKKLIAEKGATL